MPQQYADIIIYGGNVLTANAPKPADGLVAEAVAVTGERIVAVGSNQEILRMAGPQTLKVDVEFKSVIPGRIDTLVPLTEQTETQVFLAQGVTTLGAHLPSEQIRRLQSVHAPVRIAYVDVPSIDCAALRKDQIARIKETNTAVSCEPPLGVHYEDGTKPTNTEVQFGRQEGGDMQSPFRSLIDAGLHPALGTNSLNYYSLLATQQLVVRAFPNTRVLGPQQRITREEALYTSTRWAAEYVGRLQDLGSIEAGKLADIVILDRNYIQVRQDGLNEINVLVTMVGGKIVYTESDFANRKGLPQVGYRGNLGSVLIRGRLSDKLPYH